MIASIYFITGILFAIYTATGFKDRAQWLVVAPLCVMLWPLFVFAIIVSSAVFTVSDIIRGK